LHRTEHQVLLGGHVAEKRAWRHRRFGSDVIGGDVAESPCGEKPVRRRMDVGTYLRPLSVTQ
jgi:hypothetical protein